MLDSSKPTAPRPQGLYVASTIHDGIVHSAGMTPRIDGKLTIAGTVGLNVSVEEARSAAALAARNAVLAVQDSGARITRCLKMTVFVASTATFTQHTAVADGASSALAELFGDDNLPARSAVGVISLPSGSPVEVELTALVDPEQ